MTSAAPILLNRAKARIMPLAGTTDPEQSILVVDDAFSPSVHRRIHDTLLGGRWEYGWRSTLAEASLPFWHIQYAGSRLPGEEAQIAERAGIDGQLSDAPLIRDIWQGIHATILDSHHMVRAYANGMCYGADGSVHRDSRHPEAVTCVYYANLTWQANWGGETLFFDEDFSDVRGAVYPTPNRFIVFAGTIPHVARGVSRSCTEMRMTLVFKAEPHGC